MTTPPRDDLSLRRVWIAFADQFLDTETRHDLPLAALAAIEVGLTVEEASDVWRCDVVPAVGTNLLCVAGEWAGWNEEWLVARIRAVRRHAGVAGWLLRHGPDLNGGSWRAIAGCMRELLSVERDRRRAMAHDLGALASHYFDFVPRPLDPARREELRRLFRGVFVPIFAGVVYPMAGESRRAFEARVEAALDQPSARRA